MRNNALSRAIGLLTILAFTPLALVLGVVALSFLLQQFINGWTPQDWVSQSGADWIFGDGTQGAARNYFGFMLAGVPAGLLGKAVLWGYKKLTAK
jgi:hypothetical protein